MSPLSNSFKPSSITSWPEKGLIFWIDRFEGEIYKMKREGKNIQKIVWHLHSPQRLALDYITGNLYWTDDKLNVIEMCDQSGKLRHVVISSGMDRPFGIAVDPEAGILFWSDLGRVPRIEKAALDGSQRSVVVSQDHVKNNK